MISKTTEVMQVELNRAQLESELHSKLTHTERDFQAAKIGARFWEAKHGEAGAQHQQMLRETEGRIANLERDRDVHAQKMTQLIEDANSVKLEAETQVEKSRRELEVFQNREELLRVEVRRLLAELEEGVRWRSQDAQTRAERKLQIKELILMNDQHKRDIKLLRSSRSRRCSRRTDSRRLSDSWRVPSRFLSESSTRGEPSSSGCSQN